MPRQRRTATKRRVFTREQYEAMGSPLVQELFEPWESVQDMCQAYLANASGIIRAWVLRDPPYAGTADTGPGTRPGLFWLLELDLESLEAEGVLKPHPLEGHGPVDGDALVSRQPYAQPALLTHLGGWLDGEREAYRAEGAGARWSHRLKYHRQLAERGHRFPLHVETAR